MGSGDEGRDGDLATAHESGPGCLPFAAELDLRPVARWPTRLSEATAAAVSAAPLPRGAVPAALQAAAGPPRASIVVVTLDNLVFNRLCLESLLYSTQEANCEIIVVDNGSTDGSGDYLRQLRERYPRLRVIFNDGNMGFAASNNQALSAARGDALVLLNNDTVVPPGWLDRLLMHLDDPQVGMVGAVTNRAGNEAQIETSYRNYGEMLECAADRAHKHRGEQSELRVATMFCAAMRRDVFEKIGFLDEQFEVGLFEDDDYSMRVRAAGYRVACAEDVFVHHFGQASIGKLAAAGRYGELFHANRRRWEEKWQVAWQPYTFRPSPDYEDLVGRVRQLIEAHVPPAAKVLVVSKGDDALLELGRREARHFPLDEDGDYAGYNPANGDSAVRHLQELQARGAQFLVFPRPSLWWLEYYRELREYLENHCRVSVRRMDTCVVYDLGQHGLDTLQ
jgi:GT2 family glycosyltransferase